MTLFEQNVINIVKQIPQGTVLTYAEVAAAVGREGAARAVGTLMAKNRDRSVPCFRVVRTDMRPGAYNRGEEKKRDLLRAEGSLDARGRVRRFWSNGRYVSWKYFSEILRGGGVGIIPTDTIYGMVCCAKNKKSVDRVYRIRKRNEKKPCIVLISNLEEIKQFNISLSMFQRKTMTALWPGPVSMVVPCESDRFSYLHRGTKTIAFRMPNNADVLELLHKTGPLIAPSANREGEPTPPTAQEGIKIFGNKVDTYALGPRLQGTGSTLISFEGDAILPIREGPFPFRRILRLIRFR